jgi:membrane protein YdbS with pleckstrin-like domain
MLTPDEEKFLEYWEANRIREKSLFRQLSLGMPLGILMGLAILINFLSGWYTRANMVAYSQSTPYVLIVAIVIIAVFCSVFYKRHKWEMNEQHYMELKFKKESGKSLENMQQKEGNDSQRSED